MLVCSLMSSSCMAGLPKLAKWGTCPPLPQDLEGFDAHLNAHQCWFDEHYLNLYAAWNILITWKKGLCLSYLITFDTLSYFIYILAPAFTCIPPYFPAQAEVITEGQSSAVYVLHAGRRKDSCVLPGTEWLETRSRHRQLLPEPRPLLQRIHENLSGPQEAGAALQQIQRQVSGIEIGAIRSSRHAFAHYFRLLL